MCRSSLGSPALIFDGCVKAPEYVVGCVVKVCFALNLASPRNYTSVSRQISFDLRSGMDLERSSLLELGLAARWLRQDL